MDQEEVWHETIRFSLGRLHRLDGEEAARVTEQIASALHALVKVASQSLDCDSIEMLFGRFSQMLLPLLIARSLSDLFPPTRYQ